MKRKSKKILSLSILCSVAVTCVSVGMLSACNEHVHHYEWKYEAGGTEHWKECPDDGVEEEGSRGEHIFIAGECECGATETAKKYGKAHGQVKLRGIGGKYEYDFSDVTVDMGDEVYPDFDTETGELNIENIEAGKIHTLTISKPDFQPYVVSVLVEEDDDVEIGGSRGMVLQRDSFDTTVNWGNYNLSKANDETGEISVTNRHFMVLTKNNYDEVAFTLNLNGFKRPGGGIKQGLPLVGDDGNTIEQGIALAFGKDVLSVRMVGKNKVALWNTWLAGEWKGGNALTGSQEKDLYVFKNGEQYLKDFEANKLALTVYRKENRISVFLNGAFIGDGTVDDKYKDVPCSVGIIAHNAVDDISWKHWNFTVDSGNKAVTLTNNTATDAHGTITGIPESVNFGDRVTLTVTPETDYKLSALLINGVDVIKDLHGNSYSFVITKDTTVEAQFAEIVYSSVKATVSGKSFGKTRALSQGTDVTLTSNGFDDITSQLAADGLKIDKISAGVWTVNIEGYLPVEITVADGAVYDAAITLERDPFDTTVNWGEFDFEKANEAKGSFGISNDCFLILSNERYNDVAVTMYLNGAQPWNDKLEQGIAIAFGGTDVLTVRMVGKNKLALWNTWLATSNDWGKGKNALTETQENGEMYIFDVDGPYLEDFEEGKLALTVYRKGNEIIVYLNGTMVGRGTVDEKYGDAECSVGFVGLNMSKTMKHWDFTVETENLPEVSKFSVTNETEQGAHGSVTGFPEGKVDFGHSVTITVTPENGYIIEKLLINGKDVISQLADNQYTFTVKGDVTVAAVFKEIIPASIKAVVKGKAFGKTTVLPAETDVTLTSKSGLAPVTRKLTANGLEIADIASGTWTVNIEGYLPFEITVEDETEYNNEIVLERDAFDTTVGWGQFDFTQANNTTGKVGVTDGNCLLLTKDAFDEVSLTMYLGKETCKDSTQQGIAVAFGKQVITVRMVGKEKLAIWNTWLANPAEHGWELGEGGIDGSTENGNLFTFADGSQYLKDFENNNLRLTVARKGNRIFIYLNDDFIGSSSFAEKYDNAKCSIGFVGHELADGNKYWKFELKTELPKASVTDKTAVGAHGKVEGISESVNFGDTVIITVTPDANYKISALLINGKDVLSELDNNTYSFVVASAVTVEAQFAEIVNGSVNAAISGKSFGKSVAFDEGTAVTLSADGISDISATVNENGFLEIASIPVGEWKVNIDGYLPFVIKIAEATAYDTAIVLERDAFNTTINWGKFDFTQANNTPGKVGVTDSDNFLALSNEKFDDVAFTMYLNGSSNADAEGQQGIALAFGKQVITVRMVGKEKLAIWNVWFVSNWGGGAIEGSTENADLYHFDSEVGAEYLKDFDKGELRLTVFRRGNKILIYLNDDFIGSSSFAEKYINEKCSVGFVGLGMNTTLKYWNFAVNTEIPDVTVNTVGTGGSVSIAPQTVKIGDTVTITVTPDSTNLLDAITVSGGATLERQADGTYTFTAYQSEYTVTATFIKKPTKEVVASVSGEDVKDGLELVFTPEIGETVVTLPVTEGEIKGTLLPGRYTVTADGYYATTVTVTESFTVEDTITLEKLIFKTNSIGDSGDYLQGAGNTNPEKVVASANGKIYEWTIDEYDDVAVTFTFKRINGGVQGIAMNFGGNDNKSVIVRFENIIKDNIDQDQTKVQWCGMGHWGMSNINGDWDFSGDGAGDVTPLNSTLYGKYTGDGLKLTLVRKGGYVYALVDGKLYSSQRVFDYTNCKLKFALFVEQVTAGYELPFEITTDVDAVLASAGYTLSVFNGCNGEWTKSEGKLTANGDDCYAQFTAPVGTVKESATIHISNQNGGDQGFVYQFADGKHLGVRYQYDNGKYKFQYFPDPSFLSSDNTLSTGGWYGWDDIYSMSDDEKTAMDGDGLDLTFIRVGNTFYTLLGEKLIGTKTVGEEYADMGGAMFINISKATGKEFTYSHATGDGVTAPENSGQ